MDIRRQATQSPQILEATPEHPRGRRTTAVGGDVVTRVRAEFAEMRGFSPTLMQAARLFDLAPAECERVLERLVDDGWLQRTPDGCYRLIAE
jgi:hypothetical protein